MRPKWSLLKMSMVVMVALSVFLVLSNVASFYKIATSFIHSNANSYSSSPSSSSSSFLSSSSSSSSSAREALASNPNSQSGGGVGRGGGGGSGSPLDVKAAKVSSVASGQGGDDVKFDVKADVRADVKAEPAAVTANPLPEQPLPGSPLPRCPDVPPKLEGYTPAVSDVAKPLFQLEKEWGGVLKPGGHYHPPDCEPKDRTAIIIPCRNRWEHLRLLLDHLIPILVRQQLSFTFFVLESDQASHFNKGILLNAGYQESLKSGNYTCFVFQDVDLLPLNDRNLYRCGDQPRHLAVAIDKFNLRLPYDYFFGGVLALSKEQYEKVNGHSNVYFGWGGEDDDISARVTAKGYNIHRMPVSLSQYHMIRHERDKGNEVVAQKVPLVASEQVVKRMDVEGVRQVVYQKDWIQVSPLYTCIHVTVEEKKVIQSFPNYVRDMFKNGLTITKN